MDKEVKNGTKSGREKQIEALEKHRTSTQFGAERGNVFDAEKAAQTKSVRKQIRRIAALTGDPEDLMLENFKAQNNGGKKLDYAQLMALRLFQKGAAGDITSIKEIIDNVDGKVPTTEIKAEVSLDEILSQTYNMVTFKEGEYTVIESDDGE